MFRRTMLFRAALLAVLAAAPLRAQEPSPVRLLRTYFADPNGVLLDFAWRFAPGDGPDRALPDFDDSSWTPVRPNLAAADVPGGRWPGVGWFRRHVVVEPGLEDRPISLRLAAPGAAEVFLDGRRVLTSGVGGAPPEVPFRERADACLLRFEGPRHVLAVRYSYPASAPRARAGFGFHLSLADPALAPRRPDDRPWIAGAQGAMVALPLFLALLHLALFGFSPRARENLFYAVEMAAFTVIVLQEFSVDLLTSEAERAALGRFSLGAPIVAIVFGLLTYYAVRMARFPKTWLLFAAAGAVFLPLTYLVPSLHEATQDVLFFGVIVEVLRLERARRTVRRRGGRIFVWSFAVFGLTIVLQILVNVGVLRSVAGVRPVYIVGVLVSAIGMSLYLAYGMGQARLAEVENARKSRELAQARKLQLSMLPRDLASAPGLDVAAATFTAAEVGGDYYDVRPAGGGAILVAFGDATGHGLASGIVVTAAKALFTSIAPDAAVGVSLAACNRVLREMRLPGFQMCLALARISPGEIAIASAAMPPALVHRKSGSIEEIGAGGLPLGTRLPGRHEERRTRLAPGDTLLFASDGLAELLDPRGRELGYPGVSALLREAAGAGSARGVVDRLGTAAAAYRGSRPQDDDMTFLVVRVVE